MLRRLARGFLDGYRDDYNRYHYVSVESIERALRGRQVLSRAVELPGQDAYAEPSFADPERE